MSTVAPYSVQYCAAQDLCWRLWDGETESVVYAPGAARTHLMDDAASTVLAAALARDGQAFHAAALARDIGLDPLIDVQAVEAVNTLLERLLAMNLLVRVESR